MATRNALNMLAELETKEGWKLEIKTEAICLRNLSRNSEQKVALSQPQEAKSWLALERRLERERKRKLLASAVLFESLAVIRLA